MARDFTEETSAEAVAASFAGADPRLREVLTRLVEYLHGFVRDVELTQEEWSAAIDFVTATGQMCDATRQEFVLLSDVLGVSMLVDAVNNRKPAGATASTVLGPFHVVDSPARELGADIGADAAGESCLVTGRVLSPDARPLAGAVVDVWQANSQGFYDVQQPETQPEGNLRGLFTTDTDGRFWLRTVVPAHYPIPDDGPVGRLLRTTGRHPYRPAHIHVIAGARGYSPVTTHLFVAGSPYIGSDTVFGVKQSLVREFERVDDPARARGYGIANPFRRVHFDITLETAV